MRFARLIAVVVAATLASGCYHATINTGKAPGSNVINNDWAMGWVFGLIPPPDVDASACKTGVAKVETQMSFLNALAAMITFQIFTPMTITVTCASGSASLTPADRVVGHSGATKAQTAASLEAAAELAMSTGHAVYLKF